jgi:RimJ/RimL family protein N-acetyltransferase
MLTDEILDAKFQVTRRFVEPADAGFILSLRMDDRLGRFLSPTDPDVEKQERWIASYKERERRGEEFYFLFAHRDGSKYGVSRIYDIDNEAGVFEVGSWLFAPDSPLGLAVLCDLCVRDWAFEKLGSASCRFEVRKENKSVVGYHKRFAPELTGQDGLNFYFRLDRDRYRAHRNSLLKMYGYDVE